jgi:hypothetical protein
VIEIVDSKKKHMSVFLHDQVGFGYPCDVCWINRETAFMGQCEMFIYSWAHRLLLLVYLLMLFLEHDELKIVKNWLPCEITWYYAWNSTTSRRSCSFFGRLCIFSGR